MTRREKQGQAPFPSDTFSRVAEEKKELGSV
jgi:hypothetical protein